MTKKLLALGALAVAATPSFATDLWDQQPGLTNGFNAFTDEQFTDLPDHSVYNASDVIVGAGGWTVNSISVEGEENGSPGTPTQALLNIFANTGQNSVPAVQNDPTTGQLVNVTFTPLGNIGFNGAPAYFLTVSGLNLQLAAGEYWIGLTAIGAIGGSSGENEFETGFSTVNSAGAKEGSAFINPGAYWGYGSSWQQETNVSGDPTPDFSAIDIQGSAAPEPVSIALLGLGVVGLISRRRK